MTKFGRAVIRSLAMDEARDRDPDIEQAWLRIAISLIASGYVWYLVYSNGGSFSPGLVLGALAANGDMLVGAWMITKLRRTANRPAYLRYLAIFSDIAAVTLGMAGADEGGVPMIGVYLWVTVGNGFRFGTRYLLVAYWLSLAGFVLLLTLVPFWITHRAIGIGLLIALAVVPLYVLVLLSRLTAQRDAARQLSNAKSRFVANVSHELRTPLAGVFSVHELLKGRPFPPADRELVGMLGSAINTLKSSVDAILQMSKLEAGSERAEARLFNLWFFLQQLDASVRPQSVAKKLGWVLNVDPATPSVVVGDPNHLNHVAGNLINNALKFTPSGRVSLRVFPVESNRIRFEVNDTGIGIPLDQQEHLFERFVQVDSSATRRYGGTGLGTSIARDLVQLMGGTIGVISSPGEGSTFWFELPLPAPATSFEEPEWGTRRQVLVVGRPSADLSEITASLRLLGLDPIQGGGVAARVRDQLRRDGAQYLAAVLVADQFDTEKLLRQMISEQVGNVPWIVVSRYLHTLQGTAPFQFGCTAVFEVPLDRRALNLALLSLTSRLDVLDLQKPTEVEGATGSPLRILLADDNPSNQLLMSRILTGAGHSVVCAERGDQAFDLMAKETLDAAILDLNMPDMSGPDVVKLFRASSVGANRLPIIILSADATPAARQESLEAGADDFLTKPVVASSLFAALGRLVAGVSGSVAQGVVQTAASLVLGPDPTSTASIMVDPERIQALRRIARGDENFLHKYLSAAFSEIEQAISDLRTAVAENDVRAARNALHIIEGTGASVGANTLVGNCKSMRSYLGAGQDSDSAHALADLSAAYALAKSVILANVHNARENASRSDTSH